MTQTESVLIDIKINQAEALKRASEIKVALEKERAALEDLKKSGDKTSEAFVKQEAAIKALNSQYAANQRVLVAAKSSADGVAGAYATLVQKSNDAAARAKDMAAAYGMSNQKVKEAQAVALNYTNELKNIDGAAGQHTRNVGNYKTALSGVGSLFATGLGIGSAAAAFSMLSGVISDAKEVIVEFDKATKTLGAISGATSDELAKFTSEAIRLSSEFGYSAVSVIELDTELSRLGFTNKEVSQSTQAIVLAARASGEELGKTAEIVGSTTRAFGLQAYESQRVADVMSKAFNVTGLGLSDYAEAMKYVAPVSKQANISLEETSALLGILANNGIKGSQAGTSLKQIMSELVGTGGDLSDKLEYLSKKA